MLCVTFITMAESQLELSAGGRFLREPPNLVPTAQPSQLWENIAAGALRTNSRHRFIEKQLVKKDGKATNNSHDQKDDFWSKLLPFP